MIERELSSLSLIMGLSRISQPGQVLPEFVKGMNALLDHTRARLHLTPQPGCETIEISSPSFNYGSVYLDGAHSQDVVEFVTSAADALALVMEAYREPLGADQHVCHENELQRLNRQLKMLSEVNQAVVHATSEPALLDEICRIIVEIGGHAMAWVALAEDDPGKTVRIVAKQGLAPQDVERIKMTWDDSKWGRGPCGTAIKTGRTYFCEDAQTAPDAEPWRDIATEYDYHAAIALPLKSESHTYGALSIYSHEQGEFPPAELKLLEELAGDLAYGVNTLRARAIRRQTLKALRDSEEKYRDIFESANDVILAVAPDGSIQDINRRAEELTGYTHAELMASNVLDLLIVPEDCPKITGVLMDLQTNDSVVYEVRWRAKNGDVLHFEGSSSARRDSSGTLAATRCILRDITKRKRSEEAIRLNEARLEALLELGQMHDATLNEIADFALDEAIKLTRSTIGYLAFMSEDERTLTMFSWSESAKKECRIADAPLVYPVEKLGLWGEAVRQRKPVVTNDYSATNPHKRGLPDGHVPVIRHMNAPVIDGGRIVLVAGVGNKSEDYDESDIRQLVLLMDGMWKIIQRNKADDDKRSFEKQVEAQKRDFYRSTILSVTGAKLDICDACDIEPFTSRPEMQADVNEPSDVSIARRRIESHLLNRGLEGARLEEFMSGVGEALSNSVKHGKHGVCYVGVDEGSVWVAVSDRGPGIDSLILPQATLLRGFSTKPSMGLGYSIMLEVSDQILLNTSGEGTTVILVKRLRSPEELIPSYDQLADTWEDLS